MPRGDGTGPMGMGPMSGRGMGFCAGYQAPGYAGTGFGWRCGGGRGRGFRNMYYASGLPSWQRQGYLPPEPADPRKALQSQAEYLERELKKVREQLDKTED